MWCQNPESIHPYREIGFYETICMYRGRCAVVCERRAIFTGSPGRIDRETCNGCGRCVEACPSNALKSVGTYYDEETLFAEVLKDRPFFESSSGGVTFSGGEPTLQHRFLKGFVQRCRSAHIHTVMETCGYFNFAVVKDALSGIDMFLYDLKAIDAGLHTRYTGRGNGVIIQNLERLRSAGANVVIRMPLVPGYSDSPENINAVMDVLNRLGVRTIHLLPYHPMGESKIKPIASSQPYLGLPVLSESKLEEVAATFRKAGIDTVLSGWM